MAKIVIVDDEREILEPLQEMLEGENHTHQSKQPLLLA